MSQRTLTTSHGPLGAVAPVKLRCWDRMAAFVVTFEGFSTKLNHNYSASDSGRILEDLSGFRRISVAVSVSLCITKSLFFLMLTIF